jgi:hypothetical protein
MPSNPWYCRGQICASTVPIRCSQSDESCIVKQCHVSSFRIRPHCSTTQTWTPNQNCSLRFLPSQLSPPISKKSPVLLSRRLRAIGRRTARVADGGWDHASGMPPPSPSLFSLPSHLLSIFAQDYGEVARGVAAVRREPGGDQTGGGQDGGWRGLSL